MRQCYPQPREGLSGLPFSSSAPRLRRVTDEPGGPQLPRFARCCYPPGPPSASAFTSASACLRITPLKEPITAQYRRNFRRLPSSGTRTRVSVMTKERSSPSGRIRKFHAALATPGSSKAANSSEPIRRMPPFGFQKVPTTPRTISRSGSSPSHTKPARTRSSSVMVRQVNRLRRRTSGIPRAANSARTVLDRARSTRRVASYARSAGACPIVWWRSLTSNAGMKSAISTPRMVAQPPPPEPMFGLRPYQVEPPLEVLDGEDLHPAESGLERVAPQCVRTHDRPGLREGGIPHRRGEAAHHAPAVDVDLLVAGGDGEALSDALVGYEDGS